MERANSVKKMDKKTIDIKEIKDYIFEGVDADASEFRCDSLSERTHLKVS